MPRPGPTAPFPPHLRLVIAVFVASRAVILTLLLVVFPDREDFDLGLYSRYATATMDACSDGRSPYEVTAIEYPPLSVLPMVLPQLPASRVAPADSPAPERERWYRFFFRLEIAIVDCLCFILVAFLVERRYRDEPPRERAERLLLLVLCSAAVFTALYARLDYILGAMLVAGLGLMLSRASYLLSFAALAAAVHLKVTPLALAPVWVLASLPAKAISGPWDAAKAGRFLLLGGSRVAVLLLMIAAGLVPFYLAWGPRCLDFVAYHRDRGIQVESVYASAVLLLTRLDCPTTFKFGSVDLDAPVLAAVAPWITVGLLLAAALAYLVVLARAAPADVRAARSSPDAFLLHALLALFLIILANKVFSPQYLLWAIPLASLVPLAPRPRRAFFVVVLLACVLTKIVGFVFSDHVMGTNMVPGTPRMTGPTWLGTGLLVARNVMVLAAGAILARYALSGPRPAAPGPTAP